MGANILSAIAMIAGLRFTLLGCRTAVRRSNGRFTASGGPGCRTAVRLVNRDGTPGSMETFEQVVRVNLFGTFNVLRLTAAEMARHEPVDAC